MAPRVLRIQGGFLLVIIIAAGTACTMQEENSQSDPAAGVEPQRYLRCSGDGPLTGERIRLAASLGGADLLVTPVRFDPALVLPLVDRGWDTKSAARAPGSPILLVRSPATLRIPRLPCLSQSEATPRIHVLLASRLREGGGPGDNVDLALSSSEAPPVTATLRRHSRETWMSLPISAGATAEAIRVEADPDGEIALAGVVLPVGRLHLELDGEYRDAIVASSIREAAFRIAPPGRARLRFSLALTGAAPRPGGNQGRGQGARGPEGEPERGRGSPDIDPGWTFTILARSAGGQQEIFREDLHENGADRTGRWSERLIDLPLPGPRDEAASNPEPVGPAELVLTLRAQPIGSPHSLALWGSPTVEASGTDSPGGAIAQPGEGRTTAGSSGLEPRNGGTTLPYGRMEPAPGGPESNPGVSSSQAIGIGRPNVLLISLDTLRADRVGRISHGHSLTPTLNRLAREGVLFTGCRTQAPSTLYGHGTMLTGLPPAGHGATTTSALPTGVPYLPEILAGEGYVTIALTDDGLLDGRYGFARGFDRFRNVTEEIESKVSLAMEALESLSEPWFLLFHSYIVHFPYSPPEEIASLLGDGYAGPLGSEIDAPHIKKTVSWMNQARIPVNPEDLRRLESLYDGETLQADRALSRLFAWLKERGLWEKTLVVVTSDHGEEFNEHGVVALHALSCYDELMRIPLIIKPASAHGFLPGRRVDTAVRLMDLPATILDLAGAAMHPAMAGRSMAGLMRGKAEADRETICEIEDARGAAILSDGWKYHMRAEWSVDDPRTPRRRLRERGKYAPEELYDLASDPLEQENLISRHPERARELRALLMQRLRESTERLASLTRSDPSAPQPLADPEHLERLRALGYVE